MYANVNSAATNAMYSLVHDESRRRLGPRCFDVAADGRKFRCVTRIAMLSNKSTRRRTTFLFSSLAVVVVK